MRKLLVMGSALAALSLASCGTFKGDTLLLDAGGLGLDASVGVKNGITVGQAQLRFHKVPTVDPKSGALLTVRGPCNTDQPVATYGIMQGQASASAKTTDGPAGASAINQGDMTGEAAVQMSMANVAQAVGKDKDGAGYDVERARQDCSHSQTTLTPLSH